MIRLSCKLSLIFFVLFLPACKQANKEITINWKEGRAAGIVIPMHLLDGDDAAARLLSVRLENNAEHMLGDFTMKGEHVLFQPLVPLTRGLRYEVFLSDHLIGKIAVPQADAAGAPKLVAVYPSADSLPENLLKLYLQFSAPMQEGLALQNIALLNAAGDTLRHVFLNLQQELWNKEGTALTIWLDPGRIKRRLIPNQQLGNPLQKGMRYTLIIGNKWKSREGLPLQQSYTKTFSVRERDDAMPQPNNWTLAAPKPATKEALIVQLHESLDYFLLQETILVLDEKGNKVDGIMTISSGEKTLAFLPSAEWKEGLYKLCIASYLEDLAGNNLARPFDRDVTKGSEHEVKDFAERKFEVKH